MNDLGAQVRPAGAGQSWRRSDPGAEPRLFERQKFLDEMAAMFSDRWPYANGPIFIEAPPWTGRTALISTACRLAAERGFCVLRARGNDLETTAPWALVRQLFADKSPSWAMAGPDPSMVFSAPSDVAEDGAAWHAQLLERYGVIDGLLDEVSSSSPVLIAIDDAGPSDRESSGWLYRLACQLDRRNVRLLLAAAPRVRGTPLNSLDRIRAHPSTRRIMLRPLSKGGTAALLASCLHEQPAEEFVDVVHAECGGYPFLIVAVARALANPLAHTDRATPEGLSALASGEVGRAVLARLDQLPPKTPALLTLLEAVAVLGADADLVTSAQVCGLDTAMAAMLVDYLVDDGLLSAGTPLRCEHGIVKSALLGEMGSSRRSVAHLSAARLLDQRGASAEVVAKHLVLADPYRDPWAAERLQEAGREALRRGDRAAALNLMSRALSASPEGAGPQLLLDLAQASTSLDVGAATRHLRRAIDLGADYTAVAGVALALARTVHDEAIAPGVVAVLDEVANRIPVADQEARIEVEVALADLVRSRARAMKASAAVAHILEDNGSPSTRARRLGIVLVAVTNAASVAHGTAGEVSWSLNQALLPSELLTGDSWAVRLRARGLLSLARAGEHAQAGKLASVALEQAQKLPDPAIGAEFSVPLAASLLLQGRLREASVVLSGALATSDGRPWVTRPLALGGLVEVLLAQGRPGDALELLAATVPDIEPRPPTSENRALLEQRGRAFLASRRVDEALRDFELARRWAEDDGADSPSVTCWRSGISACLLAQNKPEEALRLALENVQLARLVGAGWLVGATIVELAAASPPSDRLALLREAVAVLEIAQAPLLLAGALVDLGIELQGGGTGVPEALAVVRRGADLSYRCGATGLAERAGSTLRAGGARPRRLAVTGWEALTPAERRVASLATAGNTNSQIASELFLAQKTVEGHLANIYRKLGVLSRRQLDARLADHLARELVT